MSCSGAASHADKTWKIIRDAIREINTRNPSGLSFEELYRNAYNMVLHKFGDKLYDGVRTEITAHLQQVSSKIEQAQGLEFLEELRVKWNNHNGSMRWMGDILMYMDRTYVLQQRSGALIPRLRCTSCPLSLSDGTLNRMRV